MLAVNTKVNTDYILYREFMLRINFLFILRKSVNFGVILSSKRKMNSRYIYHHIKFCWNLPRTFWVILCTDRDTETPHNPLQQDN